MKTIRYCFWYAMILALALWGAVFGADSAILTWNPNPELDIAGYVLTTGIDGVEGGVIWTREADIKEPITEVEVDELEPGTTYHFKVRAYNAAGIHGPDSDSISYTVSIPPPSKPTGLAAKISVFTSPDLKTKKLVFTAIVPLDSGDPSQFIESKAEIIPIEPTK